MHTTWQHVLIHIKSPNDLDTCHVKWVPETIFWHKKLNQTLGPFGDSSWHAQPILPKFGGVFCLCTISPQKGPKVSFDSLCQKVVLGVQTTFQVSKLFGLLICINTSCQVVCGGQAKECHVSFVWLKRSYRPSALDGPVVRTQLQRAPIMIRIEVAQHGE